MMEYFERGSPLYRALFFACKMSNTRGLGEIRPKMPEIADLSELSL